MSTIDEIKKHEKMCTHTHRNQDQITRCTHGFGCWLRRRSRCRPRSRLRCTRAGIVEIKLHLGDPRIAAGGNTVDGNDHFLARTLPIVDGMRLTRRQYSQGNTGAVTRSVGTLFHNGHSIDSIFGGGIDTPDAVEPDE